MLGTNFATILRDYAKGLECEIINTMVDGPSCRGVLAELPHTTYRV